MSILERLISTFAPHTCLVCGAEEDRLLCHRCCRKLVAAPAQCYRCYTATEDYAVCGKCLPQTPLDHVAVYTRYQGPAKDLVHRLKFERAQAAAGEMAGLMTVLIPGFGADIVLAHVPTATSRVRMRGYDQAWLLAKSLALRAGVPRRTLLARTGQTRQVGTDRPGRLRQLQTAFRPVDRAAVLGCRVVLVDDVLTTGATLETAARALKQAGAASVDAIVFARA